MYIRLAKGLIVLAPLALSLAACSGGKEPEAPVSEEPTADASEAPVATPSETVTEATPSAEATTEAAVEATPTAEPEAKPTPTKAAAAPAPVAVAAVEAPAAFTRCKVCHNAEKGAPDKIGPNLFGVFGHKMGQGSFAFSDPVKNAGLTMDEATLDKWLENPRALIPGNRMSFPGLKDPAKRKEIIDYLKSLH